MKRESTLTLTEVSYAWGYAKDAEGYYFFKDASGKSLYWRSKSEKAYEELSRGTVIHASFTETNGSFNHNGVETTIIKNVRFSVKH